MVGLSRIYRITLLFGEHGCRDSGRSAEQEESRKISYFSAKPKHRWKGTSSLNHSFLGGWQDFMWCS